MNVYNWNYIQATQIGYILISKIDMLHTLEMLDIYYWVIN